MGRGVSVRGDVAELVGSPVERQKQGGSFQIGDVVVEEAQLEPKLEQEERQKRDPDGAKETEDGRGVEGRVEVP
jgi:hypothetical protein